MEKYRDAFKIKSNNRGITLISVLIMIVIIFVIASIAITGGLGILNNSKDSNKEENLTAVKTAVNKIALQMGVGGAFTTSNVNVYGKPANSVFSSGEYSNDGWYILGEEDLEKMGITHASETYIVNYKENKVNVLSDYND